MDNSFNNTDNQLDNFFNINIDHEAHQYLKTASFWARFIAIIGFIGAGISLVNIIMTGAANIFSIIPAIIGIAVAVVLNTFLIRFANKMSIGLSTMNIGDFEEGTNQLRAYFKTFGIILIVVLAICVIFLFIYVIAVMGSIS